jgi:K+-transporting ATPase A subunit
MVSMLLIPGSLTYVFGTMLMRRRQGWAFFAAYLVMLIGFLVIVYGFESAANPLLTHLSLLGGSATREAAPGLHRGQKVCPTRAMFQV